MSKLEANTIAPATGTTLTLGESGDTVSVVDSISAVSVTATNSTIAGSNLSNAAFLAGDTSTGLGIDSNEVVSKGNDLILGVIDAGLDISFREANTERLRFELDSTPTIKGTGDTSLASTTSLSFLTNTSSEVVRFTSSGRVGIGTSSPGYLLDIGASASTNNTVRMIQANGGTAIRVGAGGSGNDVTLLRVDGEGSNNSGVSDLGQFGFSLRYMGSRSGNDNSLSLFSDNQQAGTQVEAMRVNQDGSTVFAAQVTGPTTDTLLVKNSAGSTLKTIRGV